MTTRAPRQGEEDGREYFFVTKEQFEEKIRQEGLVEYASYCGNYYGTPHNAPFRNEEFINHIRKELKTI